MSRIGALPARDRTGAAACETHLRMNGQEALTKDRIYEWGSRDPERPRVSVPLPPWLAREQTEKQFVRHPIWQALLDAQVSPQRWQDLKDTVRRRRRAGPRSCGR